MKKKQKKGYKLSDEVKEKLKEQAEVKKDEENLESKKKATKKVQNSKKDKKSIKKEEKKKLKKEKKNGKFKFSKFFETIFCVAYLGFLLFCIGKFFMLANSNKIFLIFGCLTTVLAFGDGFNLIPRIFNNIKKGGIEYKEFWFGLGNQISSITMTWFYLLLYFVFKKLFPENLPGIVFEIFIWVTVVLRVLICFLPQNNWYTNERSIAISIIRNLIFLVTGVMEIVLFALIGNKGNLGLWKISIAIGLSFIFYLPVAFGGKKHPKLGMLMIPKTICYVWIICMGLNLVGRV